MSKLRQSARGEECTVRLSCCNSNPETTVLAHAPSDDHGMALKSPDWWAAYACSSCHDALDHRAAWNEFCRPSQAWMDAIYRTHKRMRERGLM